MEGVLEAVTLHWGDGSLLARAVSGINLTHTRSRLLACQRQMAPGDPQVQFLQDGRGFLKPEGDKPAEGGELRTSLLNS